MIKLHVNNLSVEDFIYVLNTRKFITLEEWREFIRDFFADYESSIRESERESLLSQQKIDSKLKDQSLEKQFYSVMEIIDETVINRAIYMKKIENKNKYKGRYDYSKGKAQKCKA